MTGSAAGRALVTGASRGIGAEIARDLSRRGWDLVLTARSHGPLRELAGELEERDGIRAQVVLADLADPAAPEGLERATESAGIPVDLLVNNAGFGGFGPFLDSELERDLRMIQVNVSAPTALSWRFGHAMKRRGRGRILNVASTGGFQPGPDTAVYYATKAYLLSLSEALRMELRGTGVTVTTFCPGPTATGFQREAGLARPGVLPGVRVPGAAEVARSGVDAVLRGEGLVIHGWVNRLLSVGVRLTPRGWLPALVQRVQRTRG
jgi:uncharacterized protein